MTYEEWLNNIEILKKTNNEEILKKIINEPVNTSIKKNVSDKLNELINIKLLKNNDNIVRCLETFIDDADFDITLINIKKDYEFIYRITKCNNLEDAYIRREELKDKIDHIYDILIKKTDLIDDTGSLSLLVKNNRIKWSD